MEAAVGSIWKEALLSKVSQDTVHPPLQGTGGVLNHCRSTIVCWENAAATRCLLDSWHIQHHQSPLNKERGPLPGLYATLLDWLTHIPIFWMFPQGLAYDSVKEQVEQCWCQYISLPDFSIGNSPDTLP